MKSKRDQNHDNQKYICKQTANVFNTWRNMY